MYMCNFVGGGEREVRGKIYFLLASSTQSILVSSQITVYSIWKGSGMSSLTILERSSEILPFFEGSSY